MSVLFWESRASIVTPELERRITTSLRWLITDARYRFDECRRNEEAGSQGGYSDELTEAIAVLNQLENPTLYKSPIGVTATFYTETECRDRGLVIGMSEPEILVFFHHFNGQGWKKGNGQPIVDLTSAMKEWHMNRHKHGEGSLPEPEKSPSGLTPRQQDIARRGA